MNTEKTTAEFVARYCKIARPIMRRWMPPNSCVGSTRVTLAAMEALGIEALPFSVSYALAVPSRRYARVGGLTVKERRRLRKQAASWRDIVEANGWDGHLVALVAGRWLLDPSIDQATSEEHGVTIPAEVLVLDVGDTTRLLAGDALEVKASLEDGTAINMQYAASGDESYRQTDAWNDWGAVFLGRLIAAAVRAA